MVCLSRDYVRCVVFKPNNPNIVVSGSDDKTIKTWDITSGSCLSTLKVDYAVHCLTYAPNGDVLAVGDRGGNINFFNSQGEKLQSPVSGHSDLVGSISWSPDGTKVASGSDDATVRIWELATGKQLSQLR